MYVDSATLQTEGTLDRRLEVGSLKSNPQGNLVVAKLVVWQTEELRDMRGRDVRGSTTGRLDRII